MSRAPELPDPLRDIVRAVLDAAALDLPGRSEVERDLRAHFEDGLDAGVPWEELRDRFGDPAEAGRKIANARREAARRHGTDGRWTIGTGAFRGEVRQAVRRLGRAPAFTALVVMTLALGMGANTAVFTVLDAVLLEPLPYAAPHRLVRVYEGPASPPPTDLGDSYLRAPTALAYGTWDAVFGDFATLYTYRELGVDLTDGDRPVRITVVPVGAGYFETLGVPPVLGRTFLEEETLTGGEGAALRDTGAPVVILGNRLWEELFDADPAVLGRTLRLDDVPYQVVGVMPPDFTNPFGPPADAWVPQDFARNQANWGNYFLSGVARLADGVTLDAAQERATALYRQLAEANPEAGEWGPVLVPLHADVVGTERNALLWLLAGAAGLVLLTACLNVANLVLARGLGRDRDVALRTALGSGRGRILAAVLVENGLLALAGGSLGLLLAWGGVEALLRLAPDALPPALRPDLGVNVFLFALAVAALALLAFGVAPAFRMARTPPAAVLRSGDRSATTARATRRVRDGLVVVQVATALVLVTGAALLTRSFVALVDVPLPIDPSGVLTFEVSLPGARYPTGASREDAHRRLRAGALELPGVEAVGAVSWLPFSGRYHIWSFYWNPEDPSATGQADDRWYGADTRVFSGDYFGAVGLGVVRGAGPADVDLEGEPVAWISVTSEREVFGGVDPLGQMIHVGGTRRRVVGIVEDVPVDARGRTSRHTYVPHAQFADDRNWFLVQTVRARGDLPALRDRLRDVLRDVDPDLVLHRPRPLAEVMGRARAQERFALLLMGTFAGLALLLAVVGTYGVLSANVAARRREIGIRMALGASGGKVRADVLRYAAWLTLPGVVLGLAGALAGARFLDALLFDVGRGDPAAYALAAVLFLVVALGSAWLPARQATRVDPARTLTSE